MDGSLCIPCSKDPCSVCRRSRLFAACSEFFTSLSLRAGLEAAFKRGSTEAGRIVLVTGASRVSLLEQDFAKFWSDLALGLRSFTTGIDNKACSRVIDQYMSLYSYTRLPSRYLPWHHWSTSRFLGGEIIVGAEAVSIRVECGSTASEADDTRL